MRVVVPDIDVKIKKVDIPGPSRYLGWWCSCGRIHMGELKHERRCVRCGQPNRRPDLTNRSGDGDTIT